MAFSQDPPSYALGGKCPVWQERKMLNFNFSYRVQKALVNPFVTKHARGTKKTKCEEAYISFGSSATSKPFILVCVI